MLAVARLRGVAGDALRYVPAGEIVLRPGGKGRYLIEAYAVLPGEPPATGAVLEFAGGRSEEARRFLEGALSDREFRPAPVAVQAALWALLADVDRSEVEARLRMTGPDYQMARALLQSAGFDPGGTRLFR